MQVSRVSCPHCSVGLRIRDRMFVGKIVNCPECGSRFEIVADGPKKLAAKPLAEEMPAESPPGQPSRKRKRRKSPSGGMAATSKKTAPLAAVPATSFVQRLTAALKSPVVVSWIVAGAAAATLAGVAMSRSANREENNVTAKGEESAEPQTPKNEAEPAKPVLLRVEPVVARKPHFVPPKNEDVIPPIVVGRSPAEARRPLPVPQLPPVPAKPRVDIAAALSQKILLFEHSKGTTLKTLLGELEEMAGVPFSVDPTVENGPASPLRQSVVIKIEKATVGQVLTALLAKSGLTYATEKETIRIIPATTKTQAEEQAAP